ncbi:MAG: alpha/beta hydrolase [Alteromonadaceae bacterium TMED7]|nr:MAG: alpha/beta hydrolase [Alteromonadaceae bacterium TMED7]|tara:strand:- start:46267 stop:47100 length:834 start_codon:yes stop_codon:yes gene_type:complete
MIRIISLLTVLVALQACQTLPDTSKNEVMNLPYSEVASQRYQIAASNIAYAHSSLQRIYYWPAQVKTQSALIFIHGGCWLNAYDYTHARGLFTALATQGVATFAIEYRRTGDAGGGWPGTLTDIQQALPAVKQWLDEKALGDVPVYLAGHSAGGHLALLAAQFLTFPVEKVIGLAAITDPATYAKGANSCQTATPQFFNGMPDELAEAYAAATPDVASIEAPVILLQGDADAIVPVPQSQLAGSDAIISEGAGHFDWLHSQTPAYQLLLNQLLEGAE